MKQFDLKVILQKIRKKLKKYSFNLRIYNAYFTSFISITFVLVLSAIIFLLIYNGKRLVKKVKESTQLVVVMRDNLPESRVLLFQKELDSKPFVRSTDYISKQQGLEEMKAYLGNDIIDMIDFNPLPAIINVYLTADYTSEQKINEVVQWLTSQEQVDDVLINQSLIYEMNKNIKIISGILAVVAFLLFLIALTLINNTIRLVVYAKRQEIKTMQLVGASDWYILKPFIFNSLLQGFLAGMVADALIILSLLYVRVRSDSPLNVYGLELSLVLTVILALLLTSLTTYFAVKHYLSAKDEEIWA